MNLNSIYKYSWSCELPMPENQGSDASLITELRLESEHVVNYDLFFSKACPYV